ncbi:TetR/AcrR family transcriptional regulator [Actinocorallia sp. A-T 12471]|uniref:TetR/AcrR family transcriptional regulator n=1 Tax=Actinocorallia sp. A-T 12471 TaxID=3089813 RepID=UPI0029CCCE35|nr:TetR/AcrR family transcriptional regulator [Actinocorallia sp. A-T 12471]MDX6739053.1 TetR/AcrR family transcriptional regulator [Actinocorallia sp. A-T 12471]
MASLREAKKEMTRRMLLDAGLKMFTGKGYVASTVEDIAGEVGTTRMTFYAHFPSKGELMKALVAERLNEVLQRERSAEHGSTALGLVEAVREGSREALEAWLRRTSEQWPAIHPIIRIGRQAAAAEPELRDLVERWLEEAISDVEDGLVAAGRFAPHQRRFRGVLAMAQLDYVAQNWGSADWKLDREQMIEELASSWFDLLGAR